MGTRSRSNLAVCLLCLLLPACQLESPIATEAHAPLTPSLVAGERMLGGLDANWVSTSPAWFAGFRFTGDSIQGFRGGVTTGVRLGLIYLAQVASSFDETASFPVEVRFDAANPQRAYRLRRNGSGGSYLIQSTNPFAPVPFTAWDVSSPSTPRQLTVAWRDQDDDGTWNPPMRDDGLELVFIYDRTYDPTGTTQFSMPPVAVDNEPTVGTRADIVYGLSLRVVDGHTLNESTGTLSIAPQFFTQVVVDIRPGEPNTVDCTKADGTVPVAILTTPTFDATTLDPTSATFGPGRAHEIHGQGHLTDVDGDHLDDMVFHFRYGDTGLTCADVRATLSARTQTGGFVHGSDTVDPGRAGAGISGSGAHDRNLVALFEMPDGEVGRELRTQGLAYFPNGTRNSYLFNAGVWVGGVVDGIPRVAESFDPRGVGGLEFVPSEIGATGQPFRLFSSTIKDDQKAWPPEFSDARGSPVILGGAQNLVVEYNDLHGTPDDWSQPLGVEVRQRSLAYGDSAKRSAIIFVWDLTNIGWQDIHDARFVFAADPDIGGAPDDRTSSVAGLAIAWDDDFRESAFTEQPAVVGFGFLEVPAGSQTLFGSSRNSQDPRNDAEAYTLISEPSFPLLEPTDVRMYLSAGPFELPPGRTVRISGALIFGRAPAGTTSLELDPATLLPNAGDPVLAELLSAKAAVQLFYDKSLRQ